MTQAQWDDQLIYLQRLAAEGRLYRGEVIPATIPKDWPDDERYSGPANLTPAQADRPVGP